LLLRGVANNRKLNQVPDRMAWVELELQTSGCGNHLQLREMTSA
jgi:hypothetical protein